MNAEHKRKISEAKKGKDCRSLEHMQKMYDALSNRTPEQKTLAQLKREKTRVLKQLKVKYTAELYNKLEELECRIAEMEECI